MSAASEQEKARRAYAAGAQHRDPAKAKQADGLARGNAAGAAQSGGSR
ncbi:hypothetical protein GR925_25895 [Streptomyces sp. HUCO-GS316]|nr:hypothetical protein [Streptomyces sp. HUCO-GS316]MXM66770.1 hypothetical protein [Streptomyces sp. HUCO-GS316]